MFIDKIDEGYGFRLYIDGLPSVTIFRDPVSGNVHSDYFEGIPVGRKEIKNQKERYILYNHW